MGGAVSESGLKGGPKNFAELMRMGYTGQKLMYVACRYNYRGKIAAALEDCTILSEPSIIEITGPANAEFPNNEDYVGSFLILKNDAVEIGCQVQMASAPTPAPAHGFWKCFDVEKFVEASKKNEITKFSDAMKMLIGENIAVLSCRYHYRGVLSHVLEDCVILADCVVVEVSGLYSDKDTAETEDPMHTSNIIKTDAIEIVHQAKWVHAPTCEAKAKKK